eukprot:751807-Hanusia_phi.AAC.2
MKIGLLRAYGSTTSSLPSCRTRHKNQWVGAARCGSESGSAALGGSDPGPGRARPGAPELKLPASNSALRVGPYRLNPRGSEVTRPRGASARVTGAAPGGDPGPGDPLRLCSSLRRRL